MELASAVTKRVSTRKFKGGLSDASWEKVTQMTKNLHPLKSDIQTTIHFVRDGKEVIKWFKSFIEAYVKVEAPHYAIITSEAKEGYLAQVGFMGQELILKMAEAGIGTCWLGGPFKEEHVSEIITIPEGEQYVILIAFGEPAEPLQPKEARKRKDLGRIFNSFEAKDLSLAKALQIAPSAINGQPWEVEVDKRQWHFFASKPLFYLKLMKSHLPKIDVGIGMANVVWQANTEHKAYKIYKDPSKIREAQYVASIQWQ